MLGVAAGAGAGGGVCAAACRGRRRVRTNAADATADSDFTRTELIMCAHLSAIARRDVRGRSAAIITFNLAREVPPHGGLAPASPKRHAAGLRHCRIQGPTKT